MHEWTPYGYVFEPNPADFVTDTAEEEVDLELDDKDINASHEDAQMQDGAAFTSETPVRRASRGNPLASQDKAAEMEYIIKFIRDAGFPASELTESYAELVQYFAARIGVNRALERNLDPAEGADSERDCAPSARKRR